MPSMPFIEWVVENGYISPEVFGVPNTSDITSSQRLADLRGCDYRVQWVESSEIHKILTRQKQSGWKICMLHKVYTDVLRFLICKWASWAKIYQPLIQPLTGGKMVLGCVEINTVAILVKRRLLTYQWVNFRYQGSPSVLVLILLSPRSDFRHRGSPQVRVTFTFLTFTWSDFRLQGSFWEQFSTFDFPIAWFPLSGQFSG